MIPLIPAADLTQPVQTDEPVPGTPEDVALKQVLAELEKVSQPASLEPAVTGVASPTDMLVDALPTLLSMVGELQASLVVVRQLAAMCESNHEDIHALKKQVQHLTSVLARKLPTDDNGAVAPVDSDVPGQAASGLDIVDD